jgi:hypothetical protein
MYEISGISEVSRGQLPSASIPAIGMQLLVEQDETRIGVMTEQHEQAYAKLGQLILMMVEKYYQTPRLLKLAKGKEYVVKDFVGSDLNGNTDVIVIRGSTTPGSKVIRRQEIVNTYQMGLLGDPNDPKVRDKVLQMLEYGDIAEVWEEQSLDLNQIKQDIEAIEQGIAPEVNELDNHVMHIAEKNKYRKGDKFKKLPFELQELLLANIEQHVQAQMQLMNPQLGIQDELTANTQMGNQAADSLEQEKAMALEQENLTDEGIV